MTVTFIHFHNALTLVVYTTTFRILPSAISYKRTLYLCISWVLTTIVRTQEKLCSFMLFLFREYFVFWLGKTRICSERICCCHMHNNLSQKYINFQNSSTKVYQTEKYYCTRTWKHYVPIIRVTRLKSF